MKFENDKAWTVNELKEFYKHFETTSYLKNYVRPRVQSTPAMLLNYFARWLADEGYLPLCFRAFTKVKNMFGFPNISKFNKEWGKKHRSHKSQMRTIIELSLIPISIASALTGLLATVISIGVYYCRAKK